MRIAAALAGVTILIGPAASVQAPLFSPAPASPLYVGRGSGTVLIDDVNGDGHPDLLTRHLLARRITVLFGDGRGGFTASPASPIELPYEPADFALGDLNADGRPDLVVTPGQEDVVDLLIGHDGHFRRAADSPFTVTTAREPFNKRTLRLADINEDGRPDVVTANGRRRNSFEVMLGDGRGTLSRGPSVKLDSGCDRYHFALGDVNGDGHLDAVNACSSVSGTEARPRLSVLAGNGAGGFRVSRQLTLDLHSGVRSVALADLNADSGNDVVLLHGSGAVTVLPNEGSGRFSPAGTAVAQAGGDAYGLTVADLNGDGKPDLIVAAGDRVVVFVATGSGFAPAPGSPFKAGPAAYNVAAGDLNGDRRTDLVASSFEGEAITLLFARR